jgi:hypothetical protein
MSSTRSVTQHTDSRITSPTTATNPQWSKSALAVIKRLARKRETLTSADVLNELAKSDVTTADLRAIGWIMRKARALGFIENSGLVRQRNNKHSRSASTLWKSLLYQQKQHS